MEDATFDYSDVDSSGEDDVDNCQQKNTKIQKIVYLIGTAANFGAMWRFTYVMHKDGGAIFIVPYFVMMILIGFPLCYLDMMLGRCSQLGTIRVWELTKISAGVGYTLAGIAALVATYSGVITSWAFFYLFSSFRKDLPWTCDGIKFTRVRDNCTKNFNINWTDVDMAENDLTLSENFFLHRVVNVHYNLEIFHDFKYSVVACLAFTWICTCVILGKGIRSAHKLAFLGVVLVTLMLGLTAGTTIKENGYENIRRFISVNWNELLYVEPWYDAVAQVLFSLGPGYGWLMTIAYRKNQCSKTFTDCYLIGMLQGIFSFILTCTIVIVTGAQTPTQHLNHFDVYKSDIGYVFVLFAAHLARLPGSCLWCGIFFLGMAFMGLAANAYFLFGIYYWIASIECKRFSFYKKIVGAIAIGLTMFSLGLLLTTSGGYLVLRAMDQRVAELCAPLIAVLECLIIGWLYGGKHFILIVEEITGHKSRIPWRLMWEFVTPVVIVSILLSKWVNDDDDHDIAHKTSFLIGRILADLTLICIPIYSLIIFLLTCFGPNKKISQLISSSHKWAQISNVNKINSCAENRQRRRHYGDSEPVLMVRIEDPEFGEIPHGFFYNPNKNNLADILQRLPLINHHIDSENNCFEDNDTGKCLHKSHQTPQNCSSKRPKFKSNDANFNLQYSLISHDGSTPMIVARKIPYPAALSLASLPSLVIMPPHGICSSEKSSIYGEIATSTVRSRH